MTIPPGQGGNASADAAPRSRSLAALLTLAVCAALLFSGFIALGTWQVQRLQWKNALIERVGQRIHAPPVDAPGPERWPQVTAASDEYRRVRVSGIYLHEFAVRVQAATLLGAGYWVMTPLRQADGSIVLVNRGFIPAVANGERSDVAVEEGITAEEGGARPKTVTVTGLLRISEPGGGFLRNNDPANQRWFSRDVEAIAAASKLSRVAPYFVDADAASASAHAAPGEGTAARPVGGLTVVSFSNNHLVYALTWYFLALMVAVAAFWVARDARRRPQDGEDGEDH